MSDPYLWTNGEGEIVHPNAPAGGGGPGIFKGTAPLGSKIDLELADIPHPRSPLGLNSSPTNEHAQELDSGMADPASSDEEPDMRDTTGVPHDVRADTVDDFVSNSNAAMGDGDTVGHMAPDIKIDPTVNEKGKIEKVNMTVKTEIVRPRWAGGRAKDKEKELIKKAEKLIKDHEERHREICREHARKAVKAMRGKTPAKADQEFKRIMKEMDDAQVALDAKEGMLIVEHNGPAGNAGPATDVKLGPVPKKK